MAERRRYIRNILLAPVIIGIRIPIMLPLFLLIECGRCAQKVYDALDPAIPAFERRSRRGE